jgi:hypothetical protein
MLLWQGTIDPTLGNDAAVGVADIWLIFAALAYVAGYLIIEDVVQFVRYALCRLIPNPLFRAGVID